MLTRTKFYVKSILILITYGIMTYYSKDRDGAWLTAGMGIGCYVGLLWWTDMPWFPKSITNLFHRRP